MAPVTKKSTRSSKKRTPAKSIPLKPKNAVTTISKTEAMKEVAIVSVASDFSDVSVPHRFDIGAGHTVEVRIGVSGWTYSPWRGSFYPKGLKQKDELQFASRALNSLEINGTFYSLQKPASFESWYAATQATFLLSVKAPQYLTHIRRLKDFEGPLCYFLASGVLHLKEKLGAILWQFPPFMALKDDRFEIFLKALPKTVFEARQYVEERRVAKNVRNEVKVGVDRPLHHAFEFRHHSFANVEFVQLLKHYGVAMVIGDSAGKWPYVEDQTAAFRYLRLHGPEELYPRGYDAVRLEWWAKRIISWSRGEQPADSKCVLHDSKTTVPQRIYVYFDNDYKIKAPQHARDLTARLKLQ